MRSNLFFNFANFHFFGRFWEFLGVFRAFGASFLRFFSRFFVLTFFFLGMERVWRLGAAGARGLGRHPADRARRSLAGRFSLHGAVSRGVVSCGDELGVRTPRVRT